MEYIKGVTFGFMSPNGAFKTQESFKSLELLKQNTGATHVIMAVAALQDTAQSTTIDYKGEHMVADDELVDMIRFAKNLGLKVILKPMVNCRCGTWRAHINFFDIDVVCEPKWGDWFKSYNEFILHYAKIAENEECEMLIVGCELVQTERKEDYWRELIKNVKEIYKGKVSYNTDKYQEANVRWWDAVDIISSSGYYPINDWDNQIKRIDSIISKYNKPFFFAEAGCPSRKGSAMVPNDWQLEGESSLKEQEDYYEEMFEKTKDIKWIKGFGLWDWSHSLYEENEAINDKGYGIFAKPAQEIVKKYYEEI